MSTYSLPVGLHNLCICYEAMFCIKQIFLASYIRRSDNCRAKVPVLVSKPTVTDY